jgi:WD40 repeat protein/DNA-binding CsgD family transcriptional regulator
VIPWNDLAVLTAERGVSEAELKVLFLAIDGEATETIAHKINISPDAVRKRLGEVYKKFGIRGGGPGKLAKLQKMLVDAHQNWQAKASIYNSPGKVVEQSAPKRRDWGEAVNDVKEFYGRRQELTELKHAIAEQHCLFVVLLGIGGVGKTALSLELAEQLDDEFDYIIWRSLHNPPPINNLLADLIAVLSDSKETDLPIDFAGRLARLLEYLHQYRCLIILDNAETLLRKDELAGQFREGYEEYGEVLKHIGSVKKGEKPHQSCLLITSREKPVEVTLLERESSPIYTAKLEGLDQDNARKIIEEKVNLKSPNHLEELIDQYRGNPLALKIVSTIIQDLFDGNVGEFLKQGTTVFGDIRTLLADQFDRLSDIERSIMYWLAINRDWVSLSVLREDIVPTVPMPDLLVALDSLWWRSLIEKNSTGFRQQPVVMEYVIERLIEKIGKELQTEEILLFNRYALIKAQAKNSIRSSQIRFILKPILDQLLTELGNTNLIEEKLKHILAKIRSEFTAKPGYAGGNLLNLLVQLKVSLRHYDFSGITIWQAYLSDVELHQVNFSGADLSKSIFAENLSGILSVAFSPDGTLLATGDVNNKIHIQTIDGEQLLVCAEHIGWVRSVRFSPSGQILASGSDDHTIRFWDTHTGQCVKTLYGHEDIVRSVRFNADGSILASSSDDQTIKLWDVATGNPITTLQGHNARVRTVIFSPDGQILASGSSDRTIKLWDINSHKCLKTLEGHRLKVWSLAFSPDGKQLASGSNDRTIKLWDVATGKCLKTWQEHSRAILSLSFSRDGQTLASASDDQTIKLWNVNDCESFKTLKDHTSRVWSVTFSPDGKVLASGSDDQTVRLWDTYDWQCLKTLQGYTRGIRAITFSPDGQTLASGSEDRTVRIWDATTGNCSHVFQGHTGRIYSVNFNPSGQRLASASDDLTVRLWNVTNGQCAKTIQAHSDWIRSAIFSPNGQFLATASDDETIKIWDAGTGQLIRTLERHLNYADGHAGWVWSIAFGRNGKILASGSDDRLAKLWDVSTGQCFRTLTGHDRSVLSVEISPDGRLLASGSGDHTVRLWDVDTGECLKILEGHTRWIRSVAFSPNGEILATGGGDSALKLWEVSTGQCLKTLYGHRSRIRSIVFSPDGRLVASGSKDEAIRLWEVETGNCIKVLKIERPYEGMNITGVSGLKDSYKATLVALGAFDKD